MSRFTRTLLCLAALLVSVTAAPLSSRAASIIYSDLNSDPANVYSSGVGYTVSGSSTQIGLVISALPFTPGANYDLSQIDVALGYVSGTNSFMLSLVNDNGGRPGTTVLDSWTVSTTANLGTCCALDTVTPNGTDVLLGGVQYWLVAAPGAADSWAGWNWNTTGARGTVAQSTDGISWGLFPNTTLGAFDVLGNSVTATPEPSTAKLLGTALAAMLVLVHFGSRRSS